MVVRDPGLRGSSDGAEGLDLITNKESNNNWEVGEHYKKIYPEGKFSGGQ